MYKKMMVVKHSLEGFTVTNGLSLKECINHFTWHSFWTIPVSLLHKRLAVLSHHPLHLKYNILWNSKATALGDTLTTWFYGVNHPTHQSICLSLLIILLWTHHAIFKAGHLEAHSHEFYALGISFNTTSHKIQATSKWKYFGRENPKIKIDLGDHITIYF